MIDTIKKVPSTSNHPTWLGKEAGSSQTGECVPQTPVPGQVEGSTADSESCSTC